jgi:hypothetical protein
MKADLSDLQLAVQELGTTVAAIPAPSAGFDALQPPPRPLATFPSPPPTPVAAHAACSPLIPARVTHAQPAQLAPEAPLTNTDEPGWTAVRAARPRRSPPIDPAPAKCLFVSNIKGPDGLLYFDAGTIGWKATMQQVLGPDAYLL